MANDFDAVEPVMVTILQGNINPFVLVVLTATHFDNGYESSADKLGLANKIECFDDVVDLLQEVDCRAIVSNSRDDHHVDIRFLQAEPCGKGAIDSHCHTQAGLKTFRDQTDQLIKVLLVELVLMFNVLGKDRYFLFQVVL